MATIGFAKDVRPLFTADDVAEMRGHGIDLGSVDDVRRNALRILARLEEGAMPPGRPWPDEAVARFRGWIDGGTAP